MSDVKYNIGFGLCGWAGLSIRVVREQTTDDDEDENDEDDGGGEANESLSVSYHSNFGADLNSKYVVRMNAVSLEILLRFM